MLGRLAILTVTFVFLSLLMLTGCEDLLPGDAKSILIPRFSRSEIFGFVAGLGTTFAAVPDLVAMLRRRSSAGDEPTHGDHHGLFSSSVGLLRVVDQLATGDRLEYHRRVH